jgi:hypothetical protein
MTNANTNGEMATDKEKGATTLSIMTPTIMTYFLGVYAVQLHRCIPQDWGGIQVLACLAPSSQTVGTLSEKPGWYSWPEK